MSASCLLNSLTCGMSFQLMAFLPWFEYLRKYTSERFQFVSISLINFSRPTCCMHSEHAQWVVFCVWCMENGSSLILLWVAQHSRGKCLLWSMGVWASFPVSLVEDLLVKKGHSGVEGTVELGRTLNICHLFSSFTLESLVWGSCSVSCFHVSLNCFCCFKFNSCYRWMFVRGLKIAVTTLRIVLLVILALCFCCGRGHFLAWCWKVMLDPILKTLSMTMSLNLK